MTAAYLPGVGNRPADPIEAAAVHATQVAGITAAAPPALRRVKPGTAQYTPRPGDARVPATLPPLPPRLRDVLPLIVAGHSNAEIAETLRISEETVKSHARRLLAHFKVRSRVHLVAHIHRLGLLPRPDPDRDRDLDELWATGRGECT